MPLKGCFRRSRISHSLGWRSTYRPNMYKNNLIRFAQSTILLSSFVVSTPVPLGGILLDTTKDTVRTVFIQKENMEAESLIAFNQVIDEKALILKAKA